MTEILQKLRCGGGITCELFVQLLRAHLQGGVSNTAICAILAAITLRGLSPDDETALVSAIVESGQTIDLRPLADSRGRRLVRRYPTGGVSEKVALILPSLLACFSDDLPIWATFLVGRTLGFTGGSWDKLGAIPGFSFPATADRIAAMLGDWPVVMCTTGPDLAPADRELYDLRNATGTIHSQSLIVSSIASKHLALPVHRMLLDVRYGPGAFLQTAHDAQNVGNRIATQLQDRQISSVVQLQATDLLFGSSIGNSVELLEALVLMGAPSTNITFNRSAVARQRQLVIRQAATLLNAEFPQCDYPKLLAHAADHLNTGRVLVCFESLLRAHGVQAQFARSLCEHPESLLDGLSRIEIPSRVDGRVQALDQERLGRLVNLDLPGSGSTHPGAHVAGLVAYKHPRDEVRAGELLAVGFVEPGMVDEGLRSMLRDEYLSGISVR